MRNGNAKNETSLMSVYLTRSWHCTKCKIHLKIYSLKSKLNSLSSTQTHSLCTKYPWRSALTTLPWMFAKPATLAKSVPWRRSTRWLSKSWTLTRLTRLASLNFLFTCWSRQSLSLCGLASKLRRRSGTVRCQLSKHFFRIKCPKN